MKVYTKDGIVFARAESLKDIESLLAFKQEKVTTTTPKKKSYKKQYMKTCEDCGRKCKGNIGLSNHKCVKNEFAGPFQQRPVAHHHLIVNGQPLIEHKEGGVFKAKPNQDAPDANGDIHGVHPLTWEQLSEENKQLAREGKYDPGNTWG